MVANVLSSVAVTLLSVSFNTEVRTAYLSRGKVVEDRPVQANELRLTAHLGEDERFGRAGIWHFDLVNADARRQTHKPNCRDLTIFTIGFTAGF